MDIHGARPGGTGPPLRRVRQGLPLARHAGARHGPLGRSHAGRPARGLAALQRAAPRVDGVSEKMLSQTLHALERDGLVHREAQPTNPPRVDYELTPLGHEVAERLLAPDPLRGGADGRGAGRPRALRRDARRPLTASGRSSWSGSSRAGGASACRSGGRAAPSRPYASSERSK